MAFIWKTAWPSHELGDVLWYLAMIAGELGEKPRPHRHVEPSEAQGKEREEQDQGIGG